MTAPPAIDLTAIVTTPENIQFEYRIAGPFRRFPALLLDIAIRGIVLWGTLMMFVCSGVAAVLPFSGTVITVIMLISYFLLDWFYGLFFETYWNGKTPGKWISKIRVISVDGRPINAFQATIRNLLRLGDIAPMLSLEVFSSDAPPMYMIPTGLVAIVCMTITKRFQRLGDLAAGTMVVVDERAWVPANVKLEDSRVAALAEYIPAGFRMSRSMAKAIALYAERRMRMPMARRLELAGHLARPLLKQFQFREDTSADLLLCALYYREFVTKEAFVPTDKRVPSSTSRQPFGTSVAGASPMAYESNATSATTATTATMASIATKAVVPATTPSMTLLQTSESSSVGDVGSMDVVPPPILNSSLPNTNAPRE